MGLELSDRGDYWRVRVDLATLATAVTDLVIPQRFAAGAKNIGGQYTVWRDPCLVLRGFSYVFSAAAGSVGFNLVFSDRNTSPAVNTIEWAPRTAAAGTLTAHIDNIEWVLPRSGFTGSPGGAAQIGGVIAAQRVGTVAAGTLQLWGTHTIHNIGNKAYGSPVTF